MKQLIHSYNDWLCFSINHLNIAFFFLFLKEALKGFIRRISKGCIQAASSRNSKCSSAPQTCLLVFLKFCWGTTQFWTVNVRICIWPWDLSFKSASKHDLIFFWSWRLQLESPSVECAARCGLGLLTQPCTQLRFILFTPGIVWSTFQTVAASVTDPSCNCIKGISLLRKHHSWISPNVSWGSSMSLIKDGTFRLYLLCSKQKSLSFYNLHFTICHVFPPVLREGVFALWI